MVTGPRAEGGCLESWRRDGSGLGTARPSCVGRGTSPTGSATSPSTASRPPLRSLALLTIAGIVWKVLEGAWPAIQEFGISFIWTSAWNPVIGALRRPRVHHRHARHLLRRAPPRGAALDRDRPLPERARAAGDSRPDRNADRDARCGAERRHRPLGHLRARPVPARPFRAVPRQLLRMDPDLQRRRRQQAGVLAAIIVLTIMIIPITSSICRELFVSVPRDVKEASLGLGATRWEMVRGVVLPYVQGRRRGRGHARARARARRGDRGHPGDRQQSPAVPPLALRDRQHAGEPARRQLPERADEHRGRLAALPRR